MKICTNCGIKTIDNSDKCVFCKCITKECEDSSVSGIGGYPDAVTLVKKFRFFGNLFLFLSIVATVICMTIDYEISKGLNWSFIVILALIYANIVVQFAIIGRSSYRAKFIILTALGVALFIGIDAITGFYAWSINYVLPIGVLMLDLGIVIIMIINKRSWQSYIMSQILTVILSVLLIILYFVHIITWPYLIHIAFLTSVLLLVGTLILGDKKARSEVTRRFHI